MNFSHQKHQFLIKPDKSLAGGIDKAIAKLVNKINSKPEYYTNSSCAGRIILIKEIGKKQENAFLKVWHDKISMSELSRELKKTKYSAMVYLRIEPCIMHVSCKTLKDAVNLMQLARYSGWKKSGVISLNKNIVEMLSTENLSAPIINKGKILADKDYLKELASECNKKLKQTREKIKKLENNIK